jgi:hypothetical protein
MALLGLKTLAVRFGMALITYVVLWALLHPLRSSMASELDWLEAFFFAAFALAATFVWTTTAQSLRLLRATEVAMRRRRIRPMLGYTVVYGITFALCAFIDQLVDGLLPCIDSIFKSPGALCLCIVFRGETWRLFTTADHKLPPWPSDDLAHYGLLAILALVVVGARFAFRIGRRG